MVILAFSLPTWRKMVLCSVRTHLHCSWCVRVRLQHFEWIPKSNKHDDVILSLHSFEGKSIFSSCPRLTKARSVRLCVQHFTSDKIIIIQGPATWFIQRFKTVTQNYLGRQSLETVLGTQLSHREVEGTVLPLQTTNRWQAQAQVCILVM